MSVESNADLRYRPWSYDQVDKGLPAGVWFTQGGTTGDASGGHNEVTVVLREVADSLSGALFSLEFVSLQATNLAATIEAKMVTLGLDPINLAGSPIQKSLSFSLIFTATVEEPQNTMRWGQNGFPERGLFLGRQAVAPAEARVRFQVINVDGSVFGVYATGYMWSPGAANAPGGLRRPVGGVF